MKKLFYLLILLLPCIVKAEVTFSNGQLCPTYSGNGEPGLIDIKIYDMDNIYTFNGLLLGGTRTIYNSSDNCRNINEFDYPNYSMDGNHNYRYEISYFEGTYDNVGDLLVVENKVIKISNGTFTELQPHTVRFHLNGGSWATGEIPSYMVAPADEISIYETQNLSISDYIFTPLRNNYTFMGWYLEDDFSGKQYYSISNVTQDIDLYAKWVSNDTKFTVRIENEDGSLIEEQHVLVNENIEDVDSPSKEGYTFLTWCVVDGDGCYPTNLGYTVVMDDMTIRPIYVENSKAIKDVNIYIRPPRVGDVYSVDFDDEIGIIQKPEINFQVLTNNAELDWSELYTHDVFYNGGGDLFEGTVDKDILFTYSITIKLPEKLMENYTFAGPSVMNVVVNGKKQEVDCFNPMGAIDASSDINYTYCSFVLNISSSEADYKVLDGQEQKIEKGSDLVIRFDGDIDKFVGLVVDGKAVDSKYYKLEAGSTIVTLDKSYLDTLENGEYEITALYSDGDVSTSFNLSTPENVAVGEKKDDAVVVDKKEENPFTADSVIIAIIGLSISLLAFGYFFRQKYLIDKERKEFAM
ncbi:MAG: InlB B-repeat-containing protein [Bacilli bacterium]|nr:InlB B-repeat-containing protein [Bacilli bacterium]